MKKNFLCLFFLTSLFFIVSCNQEELSINDLSDNEEHELFCYHSKKHSNPESPNGYENQNEGATTRQASSTIIPRTENVENIPVFVAIRNEDVRNAVEDAIDLWSNIPNCNISFELVNAPTITGLNIYNLNDLQNINPVGELFADPPPQCLDGGSWRAQFPQGDDFSGHWISQGSIGGANYNRLVRTITHEMGHTLGFRHANWMNDAPITNQNGCNPPPQALPIACTQENDSKSIMQSAPSNKDPELTADDKRMAVALFPNVNFTPLITSHEVQYNTQSSRTVTLNFNSQSNTNNRAAYRIKVLRFYPGGALAQTYTIVNCFSGGSFHLTTTPWPGEWKFQVIYENVRGDVNAISPLYCVDMNI